MADPPFRLLVVCTANICRSVMAEHMLRREAVRRGLALEVSSCGILHDDEPASPMVIDVMVEHGLDVGRHRSRRFRADLLADVDLVVTMERFHARELAMMSGGASARIHTLGGIVQWLGEQDPHELTGSPAQRVAAFAATRAPGDVLGTGPDEVDDPHGRSRRVHRKAAERIGSLCTGLLDGLFGADEGGEAGEAGDMGR